MPKITTDNPIKSLAELAYITACRRSLYTFKGPFNSLPYAERVKWKCVADAVGQAVRARSKQPVNPA